VGGFDIHILHSFDYRLYIICSFTQRIIATYSRHAFLVRYGRHLFGTLCPLEVVDRPSRLRAVSKISWRRARRDGVSLLRTTVNLV
jgi:hypothetical protein